MLVKTVSEPKSIAEEDLVVRMIFVQDSYPSSLVNHAMQVNFAVLANVLMVYVLKPDRSHVTQMLTVLQVLIQLVTLQLALNVDFAHPLSE